MSGNCKAISCFIRYVACDILAPLVRRICDIFRCASVCFLSGAFLYVRKLRSDFLTYKKKIAVSPHAYSNYFFQLDSLFHHANRFSVPATANCHCLLLNDVLAFIYFGLYHKSFYFHIQLYAKLLVFYSSNVYE